MIEMIFFLQSMMIEHQSMKVLMLLVVRIENEFAPCIDFLGMRKLLELIIPLIKNIIECEKCLNFSTDVLVKLDAELFDDCRGLKSWICDAPCSLISREDKNYVFVG